MTYLFVIPLAAAAITLRAIIGAVLIVAVVPVLLVLASVVVVRGLFRRQRAVRAPVRMDVSMARPLNGGETRR